MTQILYVILFLIYNFYMSFLIFLTANALFEKRLSKTKTYLIEVVCTWTQVLLSLYVFPNQQFLRTILIPFLAYFVPAFLLFRGSPIRKIAAPLASFFSIAVAELLFYLILPNFSIQTHEREMGVNNIVVYLAIGSIAGILNYLIFLLFRSKKLKPLSQMTTRQGWVFFLFIMTQYVLLTLWFMTFGVDFAPGNLAVVVTVMAVCVAADFFLYHEMKATADRARLKAENDLLSQQIEAKNSYYQTLSRNYTDMSRLRHDISNHIYTMRILLEDGKKAEALDYAQRLEEDKTVRSVLSQCHNSVVYSFLTHRLEKLKSTGIDGEFDVDIPAQLEVNDTDLIIALGNMLDNAEEACKGIEAPFIRLKTVVADGFLRIETENTYREGQTRQRRIPYLDRGIGSAILGTLAEKYHGTFTAKADADTYYGILVLKN